MFLREEGSRIERKMNVIKFQKTVASTEDPVKIDKNLFLLLG